MSEENENPLSSVTSKAYNVDRDDEEEDDEVGDDYNDDSEDLQSRPTDVSFHRPTNTKELLELQQDPSTIPTLFGDESIVTIDDLIVTETDDDETIVEWRHSVRNLEKMLNLVAELIATETDYVQDLSLLCTFLDDCTYCSKTAVYDFVNSTTFIGFRVATENIKSINTLFLQKLQMCGLSSTDILLLKDSLTAGSFTPAVDKMESLCDTFIQLSPLFAQYKHLIQLHRPVTVLYAALGDNASFLQFVTEVERKLGQNFLSLSIKPVQRLPRYILLLKEMLKCVHRSVPSSEGVNRDTLLGTRSTLRETCVMISNCTLLCNNAMREYEDLQRLHVLDRQFRDCELKKKYNFVTIRKNRVHVLEGEVRRRHDRIGVRNYYCHVFSDVMLVSVASGKSLRLKNIIPLHSNSGVACVAVPNAALWLTETAEGCWFAVIAKKIMFFAVKTSVERNRWVEAINAVLNKNEGDYDILYNSERIDLYNKSVRGYYKRHGESEAGMAAAKNAVCVTQVNWWHIILLSAEQGVETALLQANVKSCNRLLRTFHKKSMGPLERVFAEDSSTHFPICFDYFFDCPKKTSRASLGLNDNGTDFYPPSMVKLYLFHDVIVAATLSGNEDGRAAYFFHINVASLEARSDSPLSVTLVDSSVVASKGIMQSLWRAEVRERTLIARSAEGAKRWLSLLREAIAALKMSGPFHINPEFCTKVRSAGTAVWRYEDRPSINWDSLA